MIPVSSHNLSYAAVVKRGATSSDLQDAHRQQPIIKNIKSIHNSSNDIRNNGRKRFLSDCSIFGGGNKLINSYEKKQISLLGFQKCATSLIRRCKAPEEVYHLIEIFKKSNIKLDIFNYNAYMYILAKAGNPEKVRAVMKEMVKAGLTPDVVSYNTLMKAWANVGNPENVRAVMKDMVGEGHTPGVVSYNSLMNAWAEAGNPEQARAVIKEMVGEGFTPDVVCYNTLMKAWANVGNPEQARAVMEEMVRAGVTPNLHSYGMLIDSWVKADIPLFATNNGYHNYILPLIKNAIDDGVLGDTVGYDKHRNIIDLHLPAVCLSQNKNGGVSFNLGRAVVDFHYHEGNLKDNPSFIVGYHEHRCHSRSVLSEAVLSELHALSSNYGDMFNYVVEPRNPGRLCRK
ncbi:hypothetical protein [Escherichia coli]|uniref:hypothetical protein n=1 Tax=Escherichia coli TaxID=562 RepID=UPI001D13DF5E|nr:hypothetical protein [Escherichia coli]